MSCAGHVTHEEEPINTAIREIEEELGIKTKKEDYEFALEYIYDPSYEIADVYFLKIDKDINSFVLQKEEVAEVRWVDYNHFKQIFKSDKFVPATDNYKEDMLDIIKNRLI